MWNLIKSFLKSNKRNQYSLYNNINQIYFSTIYYKIVSILKENMTKTTLKVLIKKKESGLFLFYEEFAKFNTFVFFCYK